MKNVFSTCSFCVVSKFCERTKKLNPVKLTALLHTLFNLCVLPPCLISMFSHLVYFLYPCALFVHNIPPLLTPEGRPVMSDVSPLSGISGLSFDSTLLSPLLFFCLVLLPFLSYGFLPTGPFF